MEKILMISQTVISVILSLFILIQNKDEGITASFNANQSFQATRRGPERMVFGAAILFGVLFLLNALAFVFVRIS